ncbi:hypothetical protein HBI18_255280 [Parastagonospora nodorum]|nr:hypothetical protein HBI18_255280 [Parastagonospora nodorum]
MHAMYSIWTIDAEFGQPSGMQAIPYSLSIRDMKTGDVVVSTSIDYGMALSDIDATLKPYVTSGRTMQSYVLTQRYLSKFYTGLKTHGLTLREVGEAIRKAGFSPDTHRVLSWHSSVDVFIFHRALLGDGALLSPRTESKLGSLLDSGGRNCLQPFNVAVMLQHCSDLAYTRCGYVFRSLLPGISMEMHLADNDTFAMYQIYKRLMLESAPWVERERVAHGQGI